MRYENYKMEKVFIEKNNDIHQADTSLRSRYVCLSVKIVACVERVSLHVSFSQYKLIGNSINEAEWKHMLIKPHN